MLYLERLGIVTVIIFLETIIWTCGSSKDCFLICELIHGQRINIALSYIIPNVCYLHRTEYFIKMYISVNTKFALFHNSRETHAGKLSYYYLKNSTCPELFTLMFFSYTSISVRYPRESSQSQWPLPFAIHPNCLDN